MNKPPASMTIQLEEKDIREDLPKIVNYMSQIRSETIRDKKFSDENKDEYLHMAYRLASGIQAISDKTMIDRMQVVANRLTKNPVLLTYDPIQDEFWKKKESRFTDSLDDLLITVVRDDFHNVDAKHHVLQAVKYLGVEDSLFREREMVYDTILPFHGPVPLETKEGILKRIFGKLIGSQYKLENLESLELRVDAIKDGYSSQLVDMARERGYTSLKIDMTEKEWEQIQSQLKNAQLIDSRTLEPNQTLVNFTNGILRNSFTKFPAYTALGTLPRSLQERINSSVENYDLETGMDYSESLELIVGVLTVIASGATALITKNLDHAIYMPVGVALVVEAMYRASNSMEFYQNNYRFKHAIGSVFLKPFIFPLELYLNNRSNKNVNVEIPVREIKASEQLPNPVSYFDRIARLKVPEEVEGSLVWNIKNHNAFGKLFIDYVNEKVGERPPRIEISDHIDRESQTISYNHELTVDGFKKNCSLYCFNEGSRYLVTFIGKSGVGNSFVEKTGKVLASNVDMETKLDNIGRNVDAKYIHLREYQSGDVVSDLEASG